MLAAVLLASACVRAQSDFPDPKPDIAGFKTHIIPLIDEYCIDCHDDATKKGKLSLEKINPDVINGDDYETWRLILDQVAFGEMPPKKKPHPSAAERKTLIDWIGGELSKVHVPDANMPERLSLPQYGNNVDHQRLFGKRLARVTPAPPRIWRLRPDIYNRRLPSVHKGGRIDGLANGLNVHDGSEFKDYAASYFLDEAATNPLLGNAKKIATAMLGKQSRNQFCKKLAADNGPPSDEIVAGAMVTVFADALGRQPTSEEKARFIKFYDKAKTTGGYKPAGKALVTAILMQPEVMYRQELGDGMIDQYGRMRLAPSEISFALSYALSNQPLTEFVQAASSGKLATSDQVAAAVGERLKDDSKLYGKNPRILQFFREYFHYPFAKDVFKDQPEGAEHDPRLLVADLETTIRDVVREDRNVLAELLTTRKYYVNANYKDVKRKGVLLQKGHHKKWSYATAYGLSWDWKWSSHLQPVAFPRDERAGVLTHPAWLAAWSGNFENHPVQRGKWIRTHLLGGTVPDVPIGVDARVPEVEGKSFRQRLQLATSAAECWRCHKSMDPLGVAFERYDHYGRYQRVDAGVKVDASATITRTGVAELDGRKFDGPTEMMDFLAKSKHVEQVFVRHAFRYFMGRNETLGDANTLQDAHKAYRDSGGSFNALVVSLLSSDSFLLRQKSRMMGAE